MNSTKPQEGTLFIPRKNIEAQRLMLESIDDNVYNKTRTRSKKDVTPTEIEDLHRIVEIIYNQLSSTNGDIYGEFGKWQKPNMSRGNVISEKDKITVFYTRKFKPMMLKLYYNEENHIPWSEMKMLWLKYIRFAFNKWHLWEEASRSNIIGFICKEDLVQKYVSKIRAKSKSDSATVGKEENWDKNQKK